MVAVQDMVSVLIPVYNREKIIHETIQSIQSQTYQNWECVFVDDGSTDKSLDLLKKIATEDPRIRFFERPASRKKGAATCRNIAYQYAQGEYIQYFDSDDLMSPVMLAEKVAALKSQPDLDFVVSKMGSFDENGVREFVDYPVRSENLIEDFLNYKVYFLTPGPLFRRRFLDQFKVKFDESLDRRQEREFYTRIVLASPNYIDLDTVHCQRRMHVESINFIHDSLSSLDKVKSKFMFYKRLSFNTDFRFSNIFFAHHGEEVLRMGLVFVREFQVLRAVEAFKLYMTMKARSVDRTKGL